MFPNEPGIISYTIKGENFEEVDTKIKELEARNPNLILLDAEIKVSKDGKVIATARYAYVATKTFYINVWDCQAKLVVNNKTIKIPDEYQEDFLKLVESVVYDDNGGAINMSGIYRPVSAKSIELFKDLAKKIGIHNKL